MSIRIAGELVRAAETSQRARFLRLLSREEKYLHKTIDAPNTGGIMHGDLEGAFSRIRSSLKRDKRRA